MRGQLSIKAVNRRRQRQYRLRDGEWQEPDVITGPAGALEGRALAAARRAAGALPQPIARYICTPADDGDGASERRVMLASLAPEPYTPQDSHSFD